MPVRYLIDEQLRDWLFDMLVRTALRKGLELDVLDVGDVGAPPLSSTDPCLLARCAENERILVTIDKSTMPVHFYSHLAEVGHSPGVLLVKRGSPLLPTLQLLIFIACESDPVEWRDRLVYI